eukprot:2015715-Pyramimonas_sp.AAC.1
MHVQTFSRGKIIIISCREVGLFVRECPRGGRFRFPSEGVQNDQYMRPAVDELKEAAPVAAPCGLAAWVTLLQRGRPSRPADPFLPL